MNPGDDLIEVNNYTYHRHSCPKNIVYYRCSDKRCKAKLHYNLESKTFVLKNSHLDFSVHKKPKLSRVITTDALSKIDHAKTEGRHTPAPIVTSESRPTAQDRESFACEEKLNPIKKKRYITLINKPVQEHTIARFYVESRTDAEGICKLALETENSSKAFCMYNISEMADSSLNS